MWVAIRATAERPAADVEHDLRLALADPNEGLLGETLIWVHGQGCSVLLRQAIGEEAIEAEGVGVEGLTHVADAVGAQDVERKGA